MKNKIILLLSLVIIVSGIGFGAYFIYFQKGTPSLKSEENQSQVTVSKFGVLSNYLISEGVLTSIDGLKYSSCKEPNGTQIQIFSPNNNGTMNVGGSFLVTNNSIMVNLSGDDTPQYEKLATYSGNHITPIISYPSSAMQSLGNFLYKK